MLEKGLRPLLFVRPRPPSLVVARRLLRAKAARPRRQSLYEAEPIMLTAHLSSVKILTRVGRLRLAQEDRLRRRP